MRTWIMAASAALALSACGGSSSSYSPPQPEEAVTVHVVNRLGETLSIAYTFARTPPTHLGGVARGGEADFTFAWEPGALEMVVDFPQGGLSSNRMSAQRGQRLILEVARNQARLTRPDGSTD